MASGAWGRVPQSAGGIGGEKLQGTGQVLYYWRSQRAVQEIQERLSQCNNLIVYDLETTGINPLYHRVIEVAAIWVQRQGTQFIEKNRLHQYFRLPDCIPLPDEIVELTGITPEKLSQVPYEDECLEDVMFFFENRPVAGYNNLGFDDLFLQQYFYRNGGLFCPRYSFDVLMMAHDFIPRDQVENYRLETVANHFGIKAVQYHAAFSDAEVTIELLNHFTEAYRNGETAGVCGDKRPEIEHVAYWGKAGQETEKDRPVHRIYVTLCESGTKIFYDIISGVWYTQSLEIDMEWLETRAWEITGVQSEKEFQSFRGKKKLKKKTA